ncbi:MAG: Asp-tRNA(Asn)/Glu-tRNA(Gln) amidotransferase subunit GatA [Clostridia bacterium]|nr:Asp-tRNA(Asn)/Glu-tRNA(Gln) amidotransferase subunit GatA [Clostridia bacterium]
MPIENMTISQIKSRLIDKQFSCKELTEAYLNRIHEIDNKVKAFLSVHREGALQKAKEVDKKIAKGESLGKLEGIPIALKDNICTNGMKTTCASKMLEDYIPPYDATVTKKLKEAGTVLIGKTNMDEFAMGSSTENSFFQNTYNPWNLKKVPGGSSGGSAAAVAAGLAPLSYGSDTGGSIRQPAAFCGLVGMKPTYGLVSRFGLIAFGSSLDQIGPLAKTVEDCALGLEAVAGHDPMDSTSVKKPIEPDYTMDIYKGIDGMKIGIPKEYLGDGLSGEIKEKVLDSLKTLESLGAKVEEFDMPLGETELSAYYIVSSAEASSNLARYDGIRYGYRTKNFEETEDLILKTRTEGFGKEVKRRIMLGTYVLSSGYYDAYYKKALQYRNKLRDMFQDAFKKYDLIAGPTSPVLPFEIGAKVDNPLEMYLADIYTVNVNLAGIPAISMPCGMSDSNLPIGLQLLGNHYQEKKLFQAAYALEQELGLCLQIPSVKEAL